MDKPTHSPKRTTKTKLYTINKRIFNNLKYINLILAPFYLLSKSTCVIYKNILTNGKIC